MPSNRPNPTFVVRRTGQDELQHWKYVKKEKVNGKWKYYYSWDELKKDAKNALGITAKQNMNTAKNAHSQAVKKSVQSYQKLQKTQKDYNSMAIKKSIGGALLKAKAKKNVWDLNNAKKDTAEKAKAYMEARSEYMKTPLGKLESAKTDIQSGYNKGKAKVSKLLKNLSKNVKNAANDAANKVKAEAKKTANKLKNEYADDVRAVKKNISNKAENAKVKVGSAVKNATNTVKREVNEFVDNASDAARDAYNRAKTEQALSKRRRK